jgi:DNA-binding transcriptional ArsR family regulator
MATYKFGVEDLLQLRFAISPMWEVVASLRRLRDPPGAGVHVPWLARLRDGRLADIDLTAAVALTPPKGYVPDFISPPPSTPLARFEDELETVRETPPPQVRHDVAVLLGSRRPPPALEPFLRTPKKAVTRLTAELARYWSAAIEPYWPRIRALLEADIAYRARRLTEGGPAALFADLHPAIAWHNTTLHVEQAFRGHVELGGGGLLLVPTAFSWIAPVTIEGPPWQSTLIYPARGVGTLWEPGDERTPEALAGVLGRTRAILLARLDAPRSTTDLARLVGITPGGASQHLGALRAAGLVASRRDGRAVLYVRTPLADRLVAGAADT